MINYFSLRSLLAIAAIVITVPQTSARSGFNLTPQVLQQLQQSKESIGQCDKELVEQMKAVRSHLSRCIQEFKKRDYKNLLPITDDGNRSLSAELKKELGPDPYGKLKGNGSASTSTSTSTSSQVSVFLDRSLTRSQISVLRANPPSTWKETPGSITVIHNGNDLAIIWGASIDTRPVRDASSPQGEFRILSLKIECL